MPGGTDKCSTCKFSVGYSAHTCQCWSATRSTEDYGNDTTVTVTDPEEEWCCKHYRERVLVEVKP